MIPRNPSSNSIELSSSHVEFHADPAADLEEQKPVTLEEVRELLIWFEQNSPSTLYSRSEEIAALLGFSFGGWATMSTYYLAADLIKTLLSKGDLQFALSIVSGTIAQIGTGCLVAVPSLLEARYLVGLYQGKTALPEPEDKLLLRKLLRVTAFIFGIFSGQPFISLIQKYLGTTGFLGITVPYVITPIACLLICYRASINLSNQFLLLLAKPTEEEIQARHFIESRLLYKARQLKTLSQNETQQLYGVLKAPTDNLETIFDKMFIVLSAMEDIPDLNQQRINSCAGKALNISSLAIGGISCTFLFLAAMDTFSEKFGLETSFLYAMAVLTSLIAFFPNVFFYGAQTQKRTEVEFFDYKTGNCRLTVKGTVAQGISIFSAMPATYITMDKAIKSGNPAFWALVPFAFAGPTIARQLPLKKTIDFFINAYNAHFKANDPDVMRTLLYVFLQELIVKIPLINPKLITALHKHVLKRVEKMKRELLIEESISANRNSLFFNEEKTIENSKNTFQQKTHSPNR